MSRRIDIGAPGALAIATNQRKVSQTALSTIRSGRNTRMALCTASRSVIQIIAYYGHAVETVGANTPIVLQDFPLATGVQITSKTLDAVFKAHPSIVMLKHEGWPGLRKISGIRAVEAAGQRRVSILVGNGGIMGGAAGCAWILARESGTTAERSTSNHGLITILAGRWVTVSLTRAASLSGSG